jgi:hypothetical protein
MGGDFNGLLRVFQWEPMRNQATNIQLSREDGASNLALERKIGGITAHEVSFLNADQGEVDRGFCP